VKTKLIKRRGKTFVRPCKTFLRLSPATQELSRDTFTGSLFMGGGAGVLYTHKNWFKQELVEFELLLHNSICTLG